MRFETWIRTYGFNNRLMTEIVLQIDGHDHALTEGEAENLAKEILKTVKNARGARDSNSR